MIDGNGSLIEMTMESSAKPLPEGPLVTYVLYAFNEEKFIREAVEGAFSQSYSPLEIVLSDDGSSDQTFEIMKEMAAEYRGPHTIILNQNESNIGIGSQLNAAWRKSRGELLILANGDDISLPTRVERVVAAWREGEWKATAIASNMEIIEQDGRRTGRLFVMRGDYSDFAQATYARFGGAGAASLAVSRRCFDVFGELLGNLLLEDGPMNLRASALGEWIFIEDPLVLYRIHGENISQAYQTGEFDPWRKRHRSAAQWQMREGQKAFVQMLWDLYSPGSRTLDPDVLKRARINAAQRLLDNQLRESYYSDSWGKSLKEWWGIMGRMFSMLGRISVKMLLPWIELRNDRWHYRSVIRNAARHSK
jgi:glycosyltransferase involved in cell wall biosynthesis